MIFLTCTFYTSNNYINDPDKYGVPEIKGTWIGSCGAMLAIRMGKPDSACPDGHYGKIWFYYKDPGDTLVFYINKYNRIYDQTFRQ